MPCDFTRCRKQPAKNSIHYLTLLDDRMYFKSFTIGYNSSPKYARTRYPLRRQQGVLSMPQHKACEKHARKSKKSNLKNRSDWSKLRTTIRHVLDSKDKKAAAGLLASAVSLIDKCAGSGLIHKNNAANKKSRLYTYVNKLQG
jgi:small subunit ribosomal protein S20